MIQTSLTGQSRFPKIVFCTTCKGRLQHLKETLPQNMRDNGSYAKFLVLDYNSQDGLCEWLRSECACEIESGRLAVYTYTGSDTFQMAHAKNMAHRLGILEGGDILVNLDADNYTGPHFARYILDQFGVERDEDIFLWSRMQKGVLDRGISGRIAVSKKAFLLAGGYDEQFNEWGPDDKDFNHRLRRLGFVPVEIPEEYLKAIRHNDKMRFREYPHVLSRGASGDVRFERVCTDTSTIANFGNIGCGEVHRRFNCERSFSIDPVPTRIFGIGMHKTATTSLHSALRILGIDSAHWQSAHWAKAIWKQMVEGARSITLEQHYALSDLPIPLLFKELDLAYTGSKFILTKRAPEKWLESVRRHWDADYNPFRKNWDSDCFTNKIHNLVYHSKQFDAEVFMTRYLEHNREVVRYFKDRPGDLLVMEMDEGAGWPELCGFLGAPIPSDRYPVSFPTRVSHVCEGGSGI